MMQARMKHRESAKEDTEKKKTMQSCTIVVSIKTANGRKNYLALTETGLPATLANEELVEAC